MTINQTCGVAISGAVPFTFYTMTFDAVSETFSVSQALTGGDVLICGVCSVALPCPTPLRSLGEGWHRRADISIYQPALSRVRWPCQSIHLSNVL